MSGGNVQRGGRPSADPGLGPVKVLTVCTYNRTRSVMMMALLQAEFDRRVGPGAVMVRSLGFGSEGQEPFADAVREMADRGLDVSAHRSRQFTPQRVGPADVVIAAEVGHVIDIGGVSPDALARTFTLPELCARLAGDPDADGRTVREWVESLTSSRDPADYLSNDVPEVDDPTGVSRRDFARATARIEQMCAVVVDHLCEAADIAGSRPD